MLEEAKQPLAFSIDFEGFVEGMEESFTIPDYINRYDIFDELKFNLDSCLKFLDENKIKATFFVVGWIGEKYPDLIKIIANNGHELASHSLYHRRLNNLPNETIKQYLEKSKKILEDITGEEVIGFRAPDFSLTHNDNLHNYMLKLGYKYDSSLVFTNIHDVYKGPSGGATIFHYKNGLIEFPISNIYLSNFLNIPVGGGGYLRFYPTFITKYFLKYSNAPMCYLHPYEISGKYPKEVSMSLYRRFRHTSNINKVVNKTNKILNNFRPISVKKYLIEKNYLD